MQSKNLSKKSAELAQANWAAATTYTVREPFTLGLPVKVLCERLRGKKGLSFTYLRHVVNNQTKSEWIDVLDKNGVIRSFKTDDVTIIPPKRKYKKRSI